MILPTHITFTFLENVTLKEVNKLPSHEIKRLKNWVRIQHDLYSAFLAHQVYDEESEAISKLEHTVKVLSSWKVKLNL